MDYKVKIIAEDKSEILFEKNIKKVDIMFDTVEPNVVSKGAGMLARITIIGGIDTEGRNANQLTKLFDWAKSEESEEQYRTVDVEIWNSTTRHRTFHFERMFVEDYEEEYDTQKDTKFTLKLIQQEHNFDKAKTGQ